MVRAGGALAGSIRNLADFRSCVAFETKVNVEATNSELGRAVQWAGRAGASVWYFAKSDVPSWLNMIVKTALNPVSKVPSYIDRTVRPGARVAGKAAARAVARTFVKVGATAYVGMEAGVWWQSTMMGTGQCIW